MQQLKPNISRVLEHMITFPWDDVTVIFLLQVSVVLSFVFLIESKKLPVSLLCMCPMKSAFSSFCSEHVHLEFLGDGAPEAREESLFLSATVKGLVKFSEDALT